MTRTSRATSPRALTKDRSESKTGLDNRMRKNGGGQHNWGSIDDEFELETAALEDEDLDYKANDVEEANIPKSQGMARRTSEEEVASAKEYRKNALKGDGIDLAAIARTSAAVSGSPPQKNTPTGVANDSTTV